MIDVLYVAGTVLFFALMLLYVAGCDRLGRVRRRRARAEENAR